MFPNVLVMMRQPDVFARAMADQIAYRNGSHRDQRLIRAERKLLAAA